MEPDEISALKLDEEFKNTLALIRPHVLSINSVYEAHLVRLWLEKLSQYPTTDRRRRNDYLCLLLHQVEQGWLQTPFNRPPPSTPLAPLFANAVKEVLSELNDNSSSWSDISEDSNIPSCCPPLNMIFQKFGSKLPLLYEMPYRRVQNCPQTYWQYDPRPELKKGNCLYTERVKCFSTNPQIYLPLGTSHKKSKEELVKTVTSLKAFIKDLQKQNDILTKGQCQQTASICSANVENDIKTLAQDISTLKSELIELQKTKVALETKHKEMVAQYRRDVNATMTGLSQRLYEAQNKNNNMEKSVEIIMQRIDNLESHEANNWRKLVLKEVAVCQIKQEELRKKYLDKVEEYESVVNSLNKKLHEKTNEVLRLDNFLKEQCSNMQEEAIDTHRGIKESSKGTQMKLQTKVKELKKAMLKHQRYSHKVKNYYKKKILELENQWQTELKVLRLQMKTQKAALSTVMADEKQRELEELVLKLEGCYRLLLADVEDQAIKEKKEDQKRIMELEIQLSILQASKSDPTCNNMSLHSL